MPSLPERAAVDPALDAVARAFQLAGALSPADARPLGDIPGVEPTTVVALVARGVVREGSPGRYYLHRGGVHERRQARLRAVLLVAGSVGLLAGLPLLALYVMR